MCANGLLGGTDAVLAPCSQIRLLFLATSPDLRLAEQGDTEITANFECIGIDQPELAFIGFAATRVVDPALPNIHA